MAKIKINKLPEGFEIVDGKVKQKTMEHGGTVTGDQVDYGLVTTPQDFYGDTNFNDNKDQSVRYSLSRVPREDANLEAEGGETVLTDLNSNGQFGLYDIKGPRHSQGGVPMYLPEQSFIFSDTNEMKMNKEEMAEFGIESRKKKTPADISRMYPLNPFYAEINSQYADDISSRSAELMLKKNMYNLSKLSFGQELKKDFEDGVPLASYPYLTEQGVDPIEFTAQIEEQTRQQAELDFIASLPPEQQDQVLRLQAMMEDIDNPDQGMASQTTADQQEAMPAPEAAQDQAQLASSDQQLMATVRDGAELPYAQKGLEKLFKDIGNIFKKKDSSEDNAVQENQSKGVVIDFSDPARSYKITPARGPARTFGPGENEEALDYYIRNGMHRNILDGTIDPSFINSLTDEQKMMYGKVLGPPGEDYDRFAVINYDDVKDTDYSITSEEFSTVFGNPNVTENVSDELDAKDVKNDATDGTVNNETPDVSGNADGTNPLPLNHPQRAAFDEKIKEGWVLTKVYDEANRKTTYTLTKPLTANKFEDFGDLELIDIETTGRGDEIGAYTDLEQELIDVYQDESFGDNVRVRKGMYSGNRFPVTQGDAGSMSWGADLSSEEAEKDFMLRWGDAVARVEGFDYQMPKGKWNGSTPVDEQAKKYQKQWLAVQNAMQEVENEFHAKNFGDQGQPRQLFPGRGKAGGAMDGMLGMQTFNKARSYLRVENPEDIKAEVLDERGEDPNKLEIPPQEKPEWWWQDLNNLATQNALENPLMLPNVPKIPDTEIDYVLDDWTGRANMTNAALNTMAKNLRAFGKGTVAGSNLFGKAVGQLAKDVGAVNTNNIKIMNSVALPQAQLNLRTGLANAKAYADEYDKTTTALQRYTDFENWDKQRTNELYNQAITNRANTFNINQLKDTMKIDPVTGGIVTQKDSKELQVDKDDRSDMEKRMDTYIEQRNKLIEKYPKMDEDNLNRTLDYILQGDDLYANKKKNNNPDTYDDITGMNKQPETDFAPSVRVNAKKGRELKPFAYPFYTGKMGM